jgi:hypothetical protein
MHSAVRLNSTPIRNSFGFAPSFGPLPIRISPFSASLFFCHDETHFNCLTSVSRIAADGLSESFLFSITTVSLGLRGQNII